MAKKTQNAPLDPFYEQVRLALIHFDDPTWLGEHSPLAAPYFLGVTHQAMPEAQTVAGRGRILQQTLREAVQQLWTDEWPKNRDGFIEAVNTDRQQKGISSPLYYYLLLELRYFRTHYPSRSFPRATSEVDQRHYLDVRRSPFFAHLKAAREALADLLLQTISPTFRLEKPLISRKPLIGREPVVSQSLAGLAEKQTVSLVGVSGVGKTAVASTITQQWPTDTIFWFTIRPTFNDQLSCLLFSLGYFLHQQGASSLWLQLVADRGQIDNFNLALDLVRGDLHLISSRSPLLCFDGVDKLYQAPAERQNEAHHQMCAFIDSLKNLAPVLLIGLQHGLQADYHYRIEGLTLSQMTTLLQRYGVQVDTTERQRLHHYTGGNPRLLQLCLALYQQKQSVKQIVSSASQQPALQTLFARTWQLLTLHERHLLLRLAVFRSPAPIDAWKEQQQLLDHLLDLFLIQQIDIGTVSLVPSIQDLLQHNYQYFSAEFREDCHMEAALIRASRGEYTASAYHYIEAGMPQHAIQVWIPHKTQEIERGQGEVALALFQKVSLHRLKVAEQEGLTLLRAELYQLRGKMEAGRTELQEVDWPDMRETASQAALLAGNFLNALGYPYQAIASYEDGIAVISRLLAQLIHLRYQRGALYTQQRQMKDAWHEVRLAQYETESLQGLVQDELGQYDEAYLSYQRALLLAKSIQHDVGIAQINRNLAIMFGRQAKLDDAIKYAQEALDYYEQTGNRFSQEKIKNMLAAIYLQDGQFEKVIEVAKDALAFFDGAKMPYWVATTGATLAEAYFEVGKIDLAESVARHVLRLEEKQSHPYVLFTLSLIERKRENLIAAYAIGQEGIQQAQENKDTYVEAYLWRELGEVLCAQKHPRQSHEALQKALSLFDMLGLDKEAERTQALLSDS